MIAGDASDPRTRALLEVVRSSSPARVLPIRIPAGGAAPALVAAFPALSSKAALEGVPTAYVCEVGSCELPTAEPAELARQLAAVRAP